jgi:hypothetical protein
VALMPSFPSMKRPSQGSQVWYSRYWSASCHVLSFPLSCGFSLESGPGYSRCSVLSTSS